MKAKVGQRFKFEAAHFLKDYPGQCANIHGHSYKLEVVLEGEVDDKTGMLLDFALFKKIVNDIILSYFDHRLVVEDKQDDYLDNEITSLGVPPTAENMAIFIREELETRLDTCLIAIHTVRLWETEDCWTEV